MSTKTKKPSSTPAMKRAVGPGGKRIPKRKPDAAAVPAGPTPTPEPPGEPAD